MVRKKLTYHIHAQPVLIAYQGHIEIGAKIRIFSFENQAFPD
jgi:hypothetical protein